MLRGGTLMSHGRSLGADNLLSSHRNRQTDVHPAARTGQSKGTTETSQFCLESRDARANVSLPVGPRPTTTIRVCLAAWPPEEAGGQQTAASRLEEPADGRHFRGR